MSIVDRRRRCRRAACCSSSTVLRGRITSWRGSSPSSVDAAQAPGGGRRWRPACSCLAVDHEQHAVQVVADVLLRHRELGEFQQLQDCDFTIGKIADSLEPRAYSSRAFIREMGKWLSEGNAKKDGSLVQLAYEHDVPIFCPAFVDCSAGFGLVKHQVDAMKRGGHYMVLDAIADFRELTDIKIKAGTTGLLMIGGGVPKNFAQDTVVCAEILGHDDVEVHKYAVQITVADVRDGACSSSTLQEAASWGKVSTAMEQMVFAEATSVLPLLASDAWHRGAWRNREKRRFAKLFD